MITDPTNNWSIGGCQAPPTGACNAMTLPVTGNYNIQVWPGQTAIGSSSIQLFSNPDLNGSITIDGPAVTTTTSISGQYENLTFNGTVGQRIAVNISVTNDTFPPYAEVTLLEPDGSVLFSNWYYANATVSALTLPATGTYTVRIEPLSFGEATIQLHSSP
jgi:hypothetical protein